MIKYQIVMKKFIMNYKSGNLVEEHSKITANLKSLMIRGIFFQKKCFTLLAVCIIFFGCNKDKPVSNGTLSEKEWKEVIASYEKIDEKAGKILLEDGTSEDFEKLIPEIQNYPMVEEVWVEDNALWIKFQKGGLVSWLIIPDELFPIDEFRIENKSYNGIKSTIKPTNTKVCLIDVIDKNNKFSKLKTDFRNSGFDDVTIINGSEANVSFFESELNQFGVIFCISHGSYNREKNVTFIVTGEEANMKKMKDKYHERWVNYQMSMTNLKENPKDEYDKKKGEKSYCMVSNKLFEETYTSNSFPNSLIYWGACQGMKQNPLGKRLLGETLSSKGVGATVGWDESTMWGEVGMNLFHSLLRGFILKDAHKWDTEYCSKKDGIQVCTHLVYYPPTADNFRLVEAPEAIRVTGISISPTSANLSVGSSQLLIATVIPSDASNNTIIWENNANTVAAIYPTELGMTVFALAKGTATITATTEDGGFEKRCIITVTDGTETNVTGISLHTTTASLSIGNTLQLIELVFPSDATNKEVTWKSDNPNVASVNVTGLVTALSEGTATITVKTVEGGFEDKCVVVVKTPPIDDEFVIINGVKWATRNVDAPGTFAAKPEDTGMLYQWGSKVAWPATGDLTGLYTFINGWGTWEKQNDPSPAGWRVASNTEFYSLLASSVVSSEWTTLNSITGRKFTEIATGKTIFFPSVGYRSVGYDNGYLRGVLQYSGKQGIYWSSSYHGAGGYFLSFFPEVYYVGWDSGAYGCSVRSVVE